MINPKIVHIPVDSIIVILESASQKFPPILILIKGIFSYLRHVNDYKVLFKILDISFPSPNCMDT